GSNLDQPGDAALVDGLSVPAPLAAGCTALVADASSARGHALVHGFYSGAELDCRDGEHLLPRLRAPGYRLFPSLVLRHANPLSSGGFFGGDAMAISTQSGLLLHRAVPRPHLLRQMAAVQLMAARHCDRAGEPGDRICHIQVARRQDGIPTLIRTARVRTIAHPPRRR